MTQNAGQRKTLRPRRYQMVTDSLRSLVNKGFPVLPRATYWWRTPNDPMARHRIRAHIDPARGRSEPPTPVRTTIYFLCELYGSQPAPPGLCQDLIRPNCRSIIASSNRPPRCPPHSSAITINVEPNRPGDLRRHAPPSRGEVIEHRGLVGEVLLGPQHVIAPQDVMLTVRGPQVPVPVPHGLVIPDPRRFEPCNLTTGRSRQRRTGRRHPAILAGGPIRREKPDPTITGERPGQALLMVLRITCRGPVIRRRTRRIVPYPERHASQFLKAHHRRPSSGPPSCVTSSV